jgi:hypothetical protein
MGEALFSAPSDARERAQRLLPTADPRFALRSWARLNGDPRGQTMWSTQAGMVYGFLPQGDDVTLADFVRKLYQYRSCTARRMHFDADGALHIRARSWFYYADATSGELQRELTNPYTHAVVPCPARMSPLLEQVMTENVPPVSTTGRFPSELSGSGQPMRLEYATMGDHVWVKREQFSRFHPADTQWYKLEADLQTHTASLDALLSEGLSHVPNTTAHNLVAEWQTWMNMHGTPGHILFVGNGGHVRRPADLPATLQAAIDKEFPGTLAESATWR